MRHAFVAVLVLLAGATAAVAQEVIFSAAISTKDAVEELGRRFAAARPGLSLRYNVGSSGELQKQIEAGAPVDLFISAAQRQMDELQQMNLIVGASRRNFARNVLTVIKPSDSKLDLAKARAWARS
jgi:molybdate transport system substrate-binding protein